MSAKLLFVEWDSRELRLVATRASGEVGGAWAAPLSGSEPQTAAAALARLVEEHRLHRAEVVLAVSRRDVELRELEIPPTPEDEQPDIVRFIAPKEFTQYDDDAVVDFYEIGRREQMHVLLAALLDRQKLQQLSRCLTDAHLTPKQFALRPLGAAGLLRGERGDAGTVRLLVDVACREADLSLHDGRRVLSVRNVRLPEDDGAAAALHSELKRTLAVARQQHDLEIAEVVVFGGRDEHVQLAAAWSLEPPLKIVDPRDGFAEGLAVDHPGRFASLLGLARKSRAGDAPAIDFLHPRERPKPQGKVTKAVVAAIAAAVLVLAVVVLLMLQLRALDREVVALAKRKVKAEAAAAKADLLVEHRDVIQAALAADVDWLAELRRVSENSFSYEDVTFTKWSGRVREDDQGGGTLTLDGRARDPDVIERLEEQLRDPGHEVKGRGHDFDENNRQHPYQFRQLSVSIEPPSVLEDQQLEAAADGADSPAEGGSDQPADDSPAQPGGEGPSAGAQEARR